MSSWLDTHLSTNRNAQIAAVAALSGAAVAATIFGTQAFRRRERIDEIKAEIPRLSEAHKADLLNEFGAPQGHQLHAPQADALRTASTAGSREDERALQLALRAQHGDYDTELIDEQLTRTASFLGRDRFHRLRDAFVVVVGLGGVGSHCVSALARSGVSRVRLIDFDQVTLSSLNRHAVATLADVGTAKGDCVKRRLQAVVPWVRWETLNEVWTEKAASRLLGPWAEGRDGEEEDEGASFDLDLRPTYVVDAIDNIDSKVALLLYCHKHRIPVISSMGAGCKSDPSRIFIGDISGSTEDPLSRVTRRKLRMAGVAEGIPVVFSTEKPGPGKAELLPLPEDEFLKGQVNELSILPDFRARILPVLGTMPAVFGYCVANFVMMEITGYPHDFSAGKARDKLYDSIVSALQGMEERLARLEGQDPTGLKLPLTKDDVGYVVEEVFGGKSVLSNSPSRLVLVRWRRPKQGFKILTQWKGQKVAELAMDELVCMTKEEAAKHEREVLRPGVDSEEYYGPSITAKVNARLALEKQFAKFRF